MEQTISTKFGNLTPYQIYSNVAGQVPRNLLTSAIIAALLWWFSGIWLLGARIGFGIQAAVAVFDALQAVFLLTVGIGALFTEEEARLGRDGRMWMMAASLVRVLASAGYLGIAYFLFTKLW